MRAAAMRCRRRKSPWHAHGSTRSESDSSGSQPVPLHFTHGAGVRAVIADILGHRGQGTGHRWLSSREHHLSPVPCALSPNSVYSHASGLVLTDPPLVVVEVLSTDDSMYQMMDKCIEYQSRGARHIWITDPRGR